MIKCSARRKAPHFSRCSMMRAAKPFPIPGSVSNSFAEAVLRLIRRGLWSRSLLRASDEVTDCCSFACGDVAKRVRLTHAGNASRSASSKRAPGISRVRRKENGRFIVLIGQKPSTKSHETARIARVFSWIVLPEAISKLRQVDVSLINTLFHACKLLIKKGMVKRRSGVHSAGSV